MKLQKYLSQSGICSRRKAEEYIERGLIFVNDIQAHIGQVIDPEVDKVRIWDEIVKEQDNLVYYIFNKPRDIVTTCLSGQEWEKWILDVVDIPERVFPVGRLDKETTASSSSPMMVDSRTISSILAMSTRRNTWSKSMER